jgi:hypothetical protein
MNDMKFELERLQRNCGNDVILNEIRRVVLLIDIPHVSRAEFDKYSKISSSTIVKRFGSWGASLGEAGLSNRYKGLMVTTRMRQQKGKRMTNTDLLNELCRVAQEIGTKALTIEQFDKHAAISAETVRRRFGSWWKALDEAGLQISNLGKRYSEDDYFENLLKVWTHHGRQPKYREMDEQPSKISSGAYEAKWGNWHKALQAFVERVNADIRPTASETTCIPTKRKPLVENTTAWVRTIPLGLRYDILKRDHFKCVLCGDSPATSPNCKLHVDHTMPFSQGGKTVKENLRTLCLSCNQGKSDKQE